MSQVACFRDVLIVDRLPKTRSGKILRRQMRAIVDAHAVVPTASTIEDVGALDEIKEAVVRFRARKSKL